MTVWLRFWVIRSLLRGVNSIRGQNPLGLCLDVWPSGFYCLPDPPVLPTEDLCSTAGGILDLRTSCGPGGVRVIPNWTAESAVRLLGVQRSAVYRWEPGIWIAASSPSVSRLHGMSGVVPLSCHGELVGLRDDSRQSHVPMKPSDWRGVSESSAERTGLISLVAGGVGE